MPRTDYEHEWIPVTEVVIEDTAHPSYTVLCKALERELKCMDIIMDESEVDEPQRWKKLKESRVVFRRVDGVTYCGVISIGDERENRELAIYRKPTA